MERDVNPPPGWHPDYQDATVERWWDGQQWTAETRPRGSASATGSMSTPQNHTGAMSVGGTEGQMATKRRKWPWIAGGVVVALIGIGALTDDEKKDETPAPVVATTTASSHPATTTTRAAAAPSTTTTVQITTTEHVAVVPFVSQDEDRTHVVVPTTPVYVPPPTSEYIPPPPPPKSVAPAYVPPPVVEAPVEEPASSYYTNCSAVRDAGAAPIYKGQPGYRSGLDRDGDGIACDK